jgi:hypothetical protein
MQKRSTLLLLCLGLASAQAEPQWIWLSNDGNKDPKVTFRHTFQAPANLKSAKLQVSCDNTATVRLNGQKVANTTNWQDPATANVLTQLKPGAPNEIIVDATNEGAAAGLVARLRVKLADGTESVLLETSGAWEATTTGTQAWKAAFVIGPYGRAPWGTVLDKPTPEAIAATK